MFTRELPEVTLAEVRDLVGPIGEVTNCLTHQVSVKLGSEPSVDILAKGSKALELPHHGAIPAFAGLLNIPEAFLGRVEPDLAEVIINRMLQRQQAAIKIRHTEDRIAEVVPAERKSIDQQAIVEIAERVIAPDAKVIDFWHGMSDFRLDVVVPSTDYGHAVGKDPEVDDYSLGGLRFEQDVKHNLAPTVQEFWYRLFCTNGQERFVKGDRVDLRGNDYDDFLTEFEALADRKFKQVEETMRHFYALKNQPVVNPDQILVRMAAEHGLPDKLTVGLLKELPALVEAEQEASMFDIVNLMTNIALAPGVKAGPAQKLERIAGLVVNDSAARCRACASKLN